MNICAITMVYRDYWALRQWYNHYAGHLGAENLYVLAHGKDAKIAQICPAANVITIPRNDLTAFDRKRTDILNDLQDALGSVFDWVIRTDVDELICNDPHIFPRFENMFALGADINCLFALGLDVAEAADDAELQHDDAVLKHRKNAVAEIEPALTTVCIPAKRIGSKAGIILAGAIIDPALVSTRLHCKRTLMIRSSSKPLPPDYRQSASVEARLRTNRG